VDESAKVAGRSPVALMCSTARSSAEEALTSLAAYRPPSESTTRRLLPPATTWLLVTMSPAESKTMPERSAMPVRMSTTEGSTCWTICVYRSWSVIAGGAALGMELVGEPVPASAQPTRTSAAPATTARTADGRRGSPWPPCRCRAPVRLLFMVVASTWMGDVAVKLSTSRLASGQWYVCAASGRFACRLAGILGWVLPATPG
jgi:hypothetical protein